MKKERVTRQPNANDVQLGRDGLYTVEAGVPLSPGKRSWGAKNNKLWTLSNFLVKFSPEGGEFGKQGELWTHAGVGYVNTLGCSYECPGAQICIDEDDRVWITEHIVFNVKAVDSAGNLIARFGRYGNADCDGDPKGPSPKPDIPLAWPQAVARHGDWLFIADRFNARIVRCRLEYAEKKEMPLD